MPAIPQLSEKAIERRVGEPSFGRGLRYFEDGAIFDTRRQGQTLKARCHGSGGQAYRVQVTFNDKEIVAAECSCPVGGGGFCKHVAALLLTWRERPEEFTEVEDLDTALEQRSREELIALIKLMLRREPDLEVLLQAPLPGAGGTPASADAYRRQAEAVFEHAGDEWDAARDIADELLGLKEIGDAFLLRKDYAGAAAVYEGVCAAVLDHLDTVHDEEGDLHTVVHGCVDGLVECLKGVGDDPALREPILRALFEVFQEDIEAGGIGLSDSMPDLAEITRPEERRVVAEWVREALPGGDSWSDNWRRESLGGLLLDLEADTLDDEAFLRICRETGRVHDLVDRLLQLGRLDEAVREAGTASDYELLGLADLFVTHGHGDVAERLVQERARESRDHRLSEWLKKRAAARGDTAAVLKLAEQLFRAQPGLEGYKEVRGLAQERGTWEALRPKLLALLKKSPHAYTLIQVYLDEGAIDEALKEVKSERGHGFGHDLALEVAEAAEATRPKAARDIYRRRAEALINQRNRGSYQEACRFLQKVRDLHNQIGDADAWTTYIAGLRERHRTLRALQEEMTRAGL
jgi:uncharacterized Zn finger protein